MEPGWKLEPVINSSTWHVTDEESLYMNPVTFEVKKVPHATISVEGHVAQNSKKVAIYCGDLKQVCSFSNELLYNWVSNHVLEQGLQDSFKDILDAYPVEVGAVITQLAYKEYKAAGSFPTIKTADDLNLDKLYQELKKHHTYPGMSLSPSGGRRPEVDKLPGLECMVKYPGNHPNLNVDTGRTDFTMTLERAIIRLNDRDKWTREQIADWLETLSIDITFRSTDADEV